MTAAEFRRHGHALIDWIAGYLDTLDDRPVQSASAPGAVRAALPAQPPETGEPFEDVLRDLDHVIVPGLTHWQSPGFFGYFPANTSGPAILGELASAGLGVQGMLWSTSPACTELETLVLDWVVELLDLPTRFRSEGAGGGVIQDTASSATLCALLAARTARPDGLVYASDQAHSSLEKACAIAGIPRDRLRLLPAGSDHALDPDALAAALAEDAAAGHEAMFVQATVGTTSSTAIDPVRPTGELARQAQAWFHVDAAYAGSAAVCPELRWIHDGLELADSYVFNPHKWLLTNFDCSCFYVADREPLLRALSVLPEYLRNAASESGAVIDYRDWQIPLGRRFRALKLWFVLRHYGAEGLRAHIRRHVALAADLARRIDGHPALDLAAPHPFALVCFRHRDGDEATERILKAVNDSGRAFLTHTRLAGRYTARVAIGSPRTDAGHIDRLWAEITGAA